jgi:hypothetical protein
LKLDLEEVLKYTVAEGDCKIWTRCLNTDGYPRAVINSNYNSKVHRELFNLLHGYYPILVRHSCDNIKCLNPDHLLDGTHNLNMKDRKERGRIPHQVFDEEAKKVFGLRSNGKTYLEISVILDIKPKRVEYILTRREES